MSELTTHDWNRTKLGDLISLQRGYDLPKTARQDGSVPVIGSGGPTGHHNVAMVRGPGITIGRAANLGVPTFVTEDFWPLNTTLFVTNFNGNDVKFVYYLLRTLNLAGYNSGSVQPMLNRNYIREFPLIVPFPVEQHAISALLGALDDKIAGNEQTLRTALDLACFRYARAVADVAKVGQQRIMGVAKTFDGPHATPKKTEHGPWFLSIGSLGHGLLDLGCSAHLSDEDFARWTRRVTPLPGDVLFSYETRLGVASLMPSDIKACLGRRMALMRPIDDRIGPATLLHAYLADEFQETIRKNTIHGATVDRIPLTDLPSWTITLPLPEYRPIIESVLSALHHTIDARQQENRTLAELRDTLLPKLISGELRIRDAERQVTEVV
jgi:type I restriction enzyme S subunit